MYNDFTAFVKVKKIGEYMLVDSLKRIFQSNNHKEIMLAGLYLSSIAIFLLLGIVSGLMGYETIFWIKLGIAVLNIILFYGYLKSGKVQLYAAFLILIVEIDSAFVMLHLHSGNFVTIYPFFVIFGFFFFFKLRAAVWMIIAHLLYWLLISVYGHITLPHDPVFQVISLTNIIVSSIIATVFAYLYHISTEITYEKLEHANRQKEILLREIHHRIKNNLNKISSMLGLQILNIENGKVENAEELLRKIKLRIEAMGMVHNTLYKSSNLEKIKFKKYITNLTDLINQTYDKNMPIEVYTDDIDLPLEVMMKIGLIINELLTNSIKHTLVEKNDEPRLVVALNKDQNNYTLRYHQQSKQSIDMETLEKTNTLGMKLIRLTVKELDGNMQISNESGLKFMIYFSC
jgi:two-component sensor histidine kinase